MANPPPRLPAVLRIPTFQRFMESNGHEHLLGIAYCPLPEFPGTSPDGLVIRFHHRIVDRYYLLSDAGVVIDGSQVTKLSDQEFVFIPKYMLLCDTDDAYQMVSEEFSRFSRDTHVSRACSYLVQEVVKANLWEARYHFINEGMDVSIETVNDHVTVVEAGDGMVPAEETAVKALLEKETAGVEGDGESCVICMEELPRGTHAVGMPCSHVFHGACIGRWLENSHYCPVCRYQMPPVT